MQWGIVRRSIAGDPGSYPDDVYKFAIILQLNATNVDIGAMTQTVVPIATDVRPEVWDGDIRHFRRSWHYDF